MSRQLNAWTIQTCYQCSKQFDVRTYLIKRGGGKFCSVECGYKSRQTKSAIEYKGNRYTIGAGGHYQSSKYRDVYLHRVIWEESFGGIPEGYVIHHIDGDKTNNCLENLACLLRGEHTSLHNIGKDRTKPKKSCKVEDCAGYSRARDMCTKHYQRWKNEQNT